MKFLIVGNADSIFIKSLIAHTLLAFHEDVCILSPSNSKFKKFYSKNNVKVFQHVMKPGTLNTLMCGVQNKHFFAMHYDVVCFHYIDTHSLLMVPVAKLYSKRIMFSYWGSDLLRNYSVKTKILGKLMLKHVNAATFCSQNLMDKFKNEYGSVRLPEMHLVDFGLDIIDTMACMNFDEHALREKYRIENDAIVVSIGYNNSPAQQHLEVLNRIALLSEETRKKMHLILRMTYGMGSKEYIEKIKNQTALTHCRFTILESYLTNKQIAEITRITDIFIHAQTTDAQSGTVCEHLYAGCLVLNPSWIRYHALENSCYYCSYPDFDTLPTLLTNHLEKKNNSQYRDRLQHNAEVIYKLCSWKTYTPKWRKLYYEQR